MYVDRAELSTQSVLAKLPRKPKTTEVLEGGPFFLRASAT